MLQLWAHLKIILQNVNRITPQVECKIFKNMALDILKCPSCPMPKPNPSDKLAVSNFQIILHLEL